MHAAWSPGILAVGRGGLILTFIILSFIQIYIRSFMFVSCEKCVSLFTLTILYFLFLIHCVPILFFIYSSILPIIRSCLCFLWWLFLYIYFYHSLFPLLSFCNTCFHLFIHLFVSLFVSCGECFSVFTFYHSLFALIRSFIPMHYFLSFVSLSVICIDWLICSVIHVYSDVYLFIFILQQEAAQGRKSDTKNVHSDSNS